MDLATASVASDKNPNFLGNEELHPYLRLSDCSQVSDGGAALVLCSEEGLAKLGKSVSDCVEVVGVGHATGNLWVDSDPRHHRRGRAGGVCRRGRRPRRDGCRGGARLL